MGSIDDILKAEDLVGVLTREVRVRLLNVSGSGCLVESHSPVDEGTTAVLQMQVDGDEYRDDVQITRCREIAGSGARYELGAEFLWTTAPGVRSIRRMARRLHHMVTGGRVSMRIEPRQVM